MATIRIYDNANLFSLQDFNNVNLGQATLITTTQTTIAGYVGDFHVSIGGIFSYDYYGLTGGTINSLSVSYRGTQLGLMTGLGHDVRTIANSSPSNAERYLLNDDDNIISSYNRGDIINTHAGNDTITAGTGDDRIDGGSGVDTVVVRGTYSNLRIEVEDSGFSVASASGRDLLESVELLRTDNTTIALVEGTNYSNVLVGDQHNGFLRDFIAARGGNDRVSGGLGEDVLLGHAGNDQLIGNAGRDFLNGGQGSDVLEGGNHSDRLLGANRSDLLEGGRGNDTLFGGNGRDRLIGQQGDDTLTGGSEADRFVFSRGAGHDTVTDFEVGRDRIEIGRGASNFGQLNFEQVETEVLVSFANVVIAIENVDLTAMQSEDNFLF